MASFSVVSNIASATAQSHLRNTNIGLQKALTRLSSGYRINTSGDDAAGLVVANSYRNETSVINQGIRNANDGLSDLQIKDGALSNVATLLDRLATLATQAASGTATDASRTTLNAEFTDVLEEIAREVAVAGLDGTTDFGFSVFVSGGGDGVVSGEIAPVTTTSLGIDASSLITQSDAQTAVSVISGAVALLGESQSTIGAIENRLQYAIALADSQEVNLKAAESRIRDADIAAEAANMTRYNILTQSGIAALAQANSATSNVLTLLR
jgi:flagellin